MRYFLASSPVSFRLSASSGNEVAHGPGCKWRVSTDSAPHVSTDPMSAHVVPVRCFQIVTVMSRAVLTPSPRGAIFRCQRKSDLGTDARSDHRRHYRDVVTGWDRRELASR